MGEYRIASDVAREMGVPVATLSAELRPNHCSAKLGADSLVPLFKALRDLGYNAELNGILATYITELQGEEISEVSQQDMVLMMLDLYTHLGTLSAAARRITQMKDDSELCDLEVTIRTEILPRFLAILKSVEARREALQQAAKKPRRRRKTETIKDTGEKLVRFRSAEEWANDPEAAV
jgi:hypothetical protein